MDSVADFTLDRHQNNFQIAKHWLLGLAVLAIVGTWPMILGGIWLRQPSLVYQGIIADFAVALLLAWNKSNSLAGLFCIVMALLSIFAYIQTIKDLSWLFMSFFWFLTAYIIYFKAESLKKALFKVAPTTAIIKNLLFAPKSVTKHA